MKKRLLSLLVALCMLATLLPVSALTAAAEEGSSGAKLEIGQDCYPVLDNVPHQTVNRHEIYTGDGWTYDQTATTLTLCPNAPTSYDFFVIHTGYSTMTYCALVIGENATVTNGIFTGSVTNKGTITGGNFDNAVTNHGKIVGGIFRSSVTNESNGIIENGQFGNRDSSCTVTNDGGRINGGTFQEMSSIRGTGSVALGYTLAAKKPTGSKSVLVNGYRNSCYVIPNQTYPASVRIFYLFDHTSGSSSLPPLDVTIDNVQHMLLSDWCGNDLKIEFVGGGRAYEVTFTAPPADGSTVTISPLTRLVIDKDGYPATAQNWNGSRASYTGADWSYDSSNDTLTLSSGTYDFTSPDLNPHGVAMNCPVAVNSNASIANGIFLKVLTGCENSTKKITVSDNGKIDALKISGKTTILDSASKEIYVVGTPTESTLYVTLSNGKVREVQLPLTADLELRLNEPEPEPEKPGAKLYDLTVKNAEVTIKDADGKAVEVARAEVGVLTAKVPKNAEVTVKYTAPTDAIVFDLWSITSDAKLDVNTKENPLTFTMPDKAITIEAMTRDATIESEGPDILGTAAMIGTVGISAAVLGYQGYMLGTELYLKYALPSGVSIPANTAELAVLIWNDAGQPAPAAVLEEDATSEQKALTWAVENQLLSADKAADASIGRAEVIRVWNQAQKMK